MAKLLSITITLKNFNESFVKNVNEIYFKMGLMPDPIFFVFQGQFNLIPFYFFILFLSEKKAYKN